MLEISYDFKDGITIYFVLNNITLFTNKTNIGYTILDIWTTLSLFYSSNRSPLVANVKCINMTITNDDDVTTVLAVDSNYLFKNHKSKFTFIKSKYQDTDIIRQYILMLQDETPADFIHIVWVDNVSANTVAHWLIALESISKKNMYIILNTVDFNMSDIPSVMLNVNVPFPYYSFNL